MAEAIDLAILARQSERTMNELASLRDDMAVVTAIVMRLDGSMATLLQEVRVVNQQIGRMNDRVRKLEGAEP
jgi:hypothetical protein